MGDAGDESVEEFKRLTDARPCGKLAIVSARTARHRDKLGMHRDVLPSALERVRGIEPLYEAWEAAVLPLNYTRFSRRF